VQCRSLSAEFVPVERDLSGELLLVTGDERVCNAVASVDRVRMGRRRRLRGGVRGHRRYNAAAAAATTLTCITSLTSTFLPRNLDSERNKSAGRGRNLYQPGIPSYSNRDV